MQTPLSKYPRLHRAINTCILLAVAAGLWIGFQKLSVIQEESTDRAEIAQLVIDEGYRACSYKDSRGYPTIGFGHLIKPGEDFSQCITPKQAVELLRDDYATAKQSVTDRYPWAEGDAYRVLVNASFQLGPNRLAKFKKSLACMEQEDYYCAAWEFIDSRWHKQTPKRAERLAGRLMAMAEDK